MTPDGEESSNAATTRDFSGRTPWPVKSMMGDIRPDVRLIPCADKGWPIALHEEMNLHEAGQSGTLTSRTMILFFSAAAAGATTSCVWTHRDVH